MLYTLSSCDCIIASQQYLPDYVTNVCTVTRFASYCFENYFLHFGSRVLSLFFLLRLFHTHCCVRYFLFCFMNTYHVDLFCSYPTPYVFIYYYNLSMWFVFFVSFSFLARDLLTYNVYLYFSVQNVVSLRIIFYYQ